MTIKEEARILEDKNDPKSNPLLQEHQQGEQQEATNGSTTTNSVPRRGLGCRKSRSWRKLADYVATGEVLLTGPTLLDRPRVPTEDSLGATRRGGADHESRRQEKETTIRLKRWHFQRMMSFSLTQVLLALLLHLVVAIIAFSFLFHNWTIIDSIYFAVTTLCTIGYGDLIPLSHAARFFTCVYALTGVTCLGVAIGVVSANIAEARDKAVRDAKESDKIRAFALFRTDSMAKLATESSRTQSSSTTSGGWQADSSSSNWFYRLWHRMKQCLKPFGATKMVIAFVAVLLVLVVFGVVISRDPAIGPSEVVYFLMITATTLGFGDFAPTSQPGRLATAIFIPLAVGTMGHWLAIVAKFIVDQRQQAFRQRFEAEGISLADLQAMDTDDDGNVSRAEFLEFMLLAMNKVDKSLLEDLRTHFDRLDSDRSGVLSKDDLIAIARRRLKTPSRKLELARYKRKLRLQADQARRKEVSWFSPSNLSMLNIFHSNSVEESYDRRGVAGVFRIDTLDSLDIARTCSATDYQQEGTLQTTEMVRQGGTSTSTSLDAPRSEARELV